MVVYPFDRKRFQADPVVAYFIGRIIMITMFCKG